MYNNNKFGFVVVVFLSIFFINSFGKIKIMKLKYEQKMYLCMFYVFEMLRFRFEIPCDIVCFFAFFFHLIFWNGH